MKTAASGRKKERRARSARGARTVEAKRKCDHQGAKKITLEYQQEKKSSLQETLAEHTGGWFGGGRKHTHARTRTVEQALRSTHTHTHACQRGGCVVARLHILMPAAVRLEAASRQDKHPEAEGRRCVCVRVRESVCVRA